MPLRINL
ncbi:hypothetical protein CGLO_18241 [Colletotrichum gloeosporioides Cg-14]|nr:hypothetical protein CGLO_18241 [Colletotrichum gloeosporioides Cg-14]